MFITLEGSDGSGKTTQAQLLVEYLTSQSHAVYHTREPGGTAIGNQIREVLHSLDNTAMHPHAEVLLYAASRAQLVAQELRPRLAKGEVVICDRYMDSSLAYQGFGHQLNLEYITRIQQFATDGLKPDLTLYFDITVEAAIERRKQAAGQGEEWNRMDAQTIEFYQRVRQGYDQLMADEPERWVRIDATQDIDTIQATVRQIIDAWLSRTNTP